MARVDNAGPLPDFGRRVRFAVDGFRLAFGIAPTGRKIATARAPEPPA